MRNVRTIIARVGTAAVMAAGLVLTVTPAASAGERIVCNAAFCNITTGSGTSVTQIEGIKIKGNRGVVGFFEVFWPGGKKTGPTNAQDSTVFPARGTVAKGELVCVRFFAKTTRGFVEVGTAQCTTSPF